jgi:hypothetical protein
MQVSDDEGSKLKWWVLFIVIFGLGNLILYLATGIFFLPLPRK